MTAERVPAEVKALALATLAKMIEDERKLTATDFTHLYLAGSKQSFRSPLGDALGSVLRTDPEPTWQVTDPAALHDHLRDHFPGVVETVLYLTRTDGDPIELDPLDRELIDTLREHIPHRVIEEERISPDAVAAAVEQSKATGKAAAPGITLLRSGGQMRVVPAKGAAEALRRMVAAGLFRMDTLSITAVPAETEREAS